MSKTIVLAERIEDVVIITPRSLDRALGVTAHEVLAVKSIAGQPGFRKLWEAIEPCLVTSPGAGGIAGPATTATPAPVPTHNRWAPNCERPRSMRGPDTQFLIDYNRGERCEVCGEVSND